VFLNLFQDGDGALIVDPDVLADVRRLASDGVRVVALRRDALRTLARSGAAFLPLTHPAARGRIRTRAIYQAHVADVLARAA